MEDDFNPIDKIKRLSDLAKDVVVLPMISPKRYFRSGEEILKMANSYANENQTADAFLLYSKFITLFVEKLPSHPDYAIISKEQRNIQKKRLKLAFDIAERLKQKLIRQYNSDQEVYRASTTMIKMRQLAEEERACHLAEDTKKRQRLAEISSEQQQLIDEQQTMLNSFHAPQHARSPEEFAVQLWDHQTPLDRPGRSSPTPDVDRSLKPKHYTSGLSPTEHVHGWRGLDVPSQLAARFLEVARGNTDLNRETCGILGGRLEHNHFRVTHLIIPSQSGTSDSCTALNEEDIFRAQDELSLITLGWIHTHPSQTSFLSSVDLHNHMSYQLLLPESTAIVCAPSYQETRAFSICPGRGMTEISDCRKEGHHLHSDHVYEESTHLTFVDSLSVDVKDLRRY